jgi:Sulfotransferase family
MLISFKHRFIFIANPKAASTSMELALRPFSEICFMEPPPLKHLSFSEVMQKFSWMFDQIPLNRFFVFGVMRHPVELILSLFNSHTNDAFKDRPYLYTGNMNFDDFITDWCTRNADQIGPQYNRFVDLKGTIFANYIISYHNLELGFEHVKSITGTQSAGALPRANASDYKIFRRDLTPSQLEWIRDRFEEDIEFMSLYCDRPLSCEECEMQKRGTASPALAVRTSTKSRDRQPAKNIL